MKKPFPLIIALIVALVLLLVAIYYYNSPRVVKTKSKSAAPISDKDSLTLRAKGQALKKFAEAKNFNNRYCFLINMEKKSGTKRFYIYDMDQQQVIDAGLTAHGRCNGAVFIHRQYNNVVGGGCTSLGRYKVGVAYQGQFGLAYKLHGLDNSNSNAFKRFVVLHSHACVPDEEVAPYPICQSDGCPTVSPAFLGKLANFIDQSDRPLLMEIFDGA